MAEPCEDSIKDDTEEHEESSGKLNDQVSNRCVVVRF